MKKNNFIWSDNWWIEDDKAWFIPGDGNCNAIFCMDLINRSCSYIAEMPEGLIRGFRLYLGCVKYKNEIFCIPNQGNYMWVYNLNLNKFTKMEICNPENVGLNIYHFWKYEESIFCVSNGLKQIIEIDVNRKEIIAYYNIFENVSDKVTVNSILVNNDIFMVSTNSNHIYQFNIVKKCIKKYELKDIEAKLYSICFDGENFWLGGYRKEIYRWNRKKNIIEIVKDIPSNFGIYRKTKEKRYALDCKSYEYNEPPFLNIIPTEKSIWFVPFRTNKIVYVDKKTSKVNFFEIKDEEEKENGILQNKLCAKYIFQYVIENRYIGLFSLKNNCIVEIDTLEKMTEYKSYSFNEETLKKLLQLYEKENKVYYEDNPIDHLLFRQRFCS